MGTGYSRNDTSNNIADGNIINASDLDGEFDAIQSAFNASTGHTHDGTTAEGAPITVTGPAQEYVSTGSELRPKANNTYDLGSAANQWKDLYVDGTANLDAVDIDGGNIDGTTIGASTAAAGTFTTATATTGNITTVNATTVDTTNIEVTNIKAKDGTASATIADSTGVMTVASSVLTTTDINGGTIDGTTIGGTTPAAITGTTITGTSFVTTGDMTFGDNDKAIFGVSGDLQIYHDPINGSYVSDQGVGSLNLLGSTYIRIKDATDSNTAAEFNPTGASAFYYNNAQKLATTNTGIAVTGDATFADNGKAIFGAGSDLQIYHSGSGNSVISEAGSGNLLILADELQVLNAANTEAKATFNTDGAVNLYYDGSPKLATTSTGVDVTGTITSDGLTLNGSANQIVQWSKVGQEVWKMEQGNDAMYFLQDGVARAVYSTNGDISFYEDTGTTAKFFWDASTESLGIGTTTPNSPVDINTSTSGTHLRLTYVGVRTWNAGVQSGGAFAIRDANAATNRLVIDTSGNVGIGTSSPASALDVVGTVTANGLTVGGTEATFGGASGEYKIILEGSAAPRQNYIGMTGYDSLVLAADEDNLGTASDIQFRVDAKQVAAFSAGGDISFYDDTGTTPKFFWDASAESLGIGTTPNKELHVKNSGSNLVGDSQILIEGNTGGYGAGISFQSQLTGGSLAEMARITADGEQAWDTTAANQDANLRFYTSLDGTVAERMRITSDGSVGIGASSPAFNAGSGIEIERSGEATLRLQDTTNTANGEVRSGNAGLTFYAGAYGTSGAPFIWNAGGTERMRIDSSGNLLVNHTSLSDWTSTVGAQVRGTGYVIGTVDGDYPFVANRLTSDGDIMQFRKDGTTVGSIAAKDGDLTIGTGDTGVRFYDGGDAVYPVNASTQAGLDATIDLGRSDGGGTFRFKDLYLSGGVYLGGTTSANLLDDYETGTFTPTTAGDATGAFSSSEGYYTKIGRLVAIEILFDVSTNFTANAIGGLPFTVANLATLSSLGQCSITLCSTTPSEPVIASVSEGGTQAAFSLGSSGTTHAPNTTQNVYRFCLSYMTT